MIASWIACFCDKKYVTNFLQLRNLNIPYSPVSLTKVSLPVLQYPLLYIIFQYLGKESMCSQTMEMLIKNFYRHPGTALYNTMVSGFDSYYRFAFKKVQRPPIW